MLRALRNRREEAEGWNAGQREGKGCGGVCCSLLIILVDVEGLCALASDLFIMYHARGFGQMPLHPCTVLYSR